MAKTLDQIANTHITPGMKVKNLSKNKISEIVTLGPAYRADNLDTLIVLRHEDGSIECNMKRSMTNYIYSE